MTTRHRNHGPRSTVPTRGTTAAARRRTNSGKPRPTQPRPRRAAPRDPDVEIIKSFKQTFNKVLLIVARGRARPAPAPKRRPWPFMAGCLTVLAVAWWTDPATIAALLRGG